MSDCVPHLNGKPTTYEALKKELRDNRKLLTKYVDGAKTDVPEMPFSKTWETLAMRRMIRYAAENGYDQVAWTNGEQQAARYDLSKQVAKISAWSADSDGLYDIHVTDKNGALHRFDNQPADKLPDLVGKEMAEKIVNSPEINDKGLHLSGLDLKVGGEGMKGFYDKILPSVANDLGKKFGAKVQQASIGGDAKIEKIGSGWKVTLGDGDVQKFSDEAGAREYAERFNQSEEPVHSLPITPEMKESVMTKGQPLFLPQGPAKAPIAPSARPRGLGRVTPPDDRKKLRNASL